MLALAKKIVRGEEDADSAESAFAQAQQVAAEAEKLLAEAEWAAPERVEVGGALVGVDRDDHRDDVRDPQRTLFSWTDFMAGEPHQPERRRPTYSESNELC